MKYISLILLFLYSCGEKGKEDNIFLKLNSVNPNVINSKNIQFPDMFTRELPEIYNMIMEHKITYEELKIIISFFDRYVKLKSFMDNATQYNKDLFNNILKCLVEKYYDKMDFMLNNKNDFDNFKKVISKNFKYESEYMYPIFEAILTNYVKKLYTKNDDVNLNIFDVTISLYAFHLNKVQFVSDDLKIKSIFDTPKINKETIENYVNKYITNSIHKYVIKKHINTKREEDKKKNEDLVYQNFYRENLEKWLNSYEGLDKICSISKKYLLDNIAKKDLELNAQQIGKFNRIFKNCVNNGVLINVKKIAQDGNVLFDSQYSFGKFLCLFLLTKCQRDHTSNKIIGDNFITNIFKNPLQPDVKLYCVESLEKYNCIDEEIFERLSDKPYDMNSAKEVVATIKNQLDKLDKR